MMGSCNLRNVLVAVIVVVVVIPKSNTLIANSTCVKSIARNTSKLCPTWFVPSSRDQNECNCGQDYQKGVKCYSYSNSTSLKTAYCMTYNETSKLTFLGECPYNTIPEATLYCPLPKDVLQLNEWMCGPLNRTGLLCCHCQQGLGTAVFSPYRECVECIDEPYGWILYFIIAIFLQTILCLFVIVFRINAASPSLNGFILVAQMITNVMNTTPSNTVNGEYKLLRKIVVTCYGFWNLDFFSYLIPPFCIKEGISTLTIIALEYVVALYPIIFTVVVYYCITFHDNGWGVFVFCWRPFHRCFTRFRQTWGLRGSVINAFATFLLLSYSKLCSISFSLLRSVPVYDICGSYSNRVYHDMSYENMSIHHLPYLLLASLMIIIFICLPALFILFYQNKLFQKCLSTCKVRCVLIHELANICQGCFKNGTSPDTRDYRWFAGLYLLLRILLIVIVHQKYYSLILIIVLSVMSTLVAIVRPYRIEFYNKLDSVGWMVFAIRTSWCVYVVDYEDLSPNGNQLLVGIPLAYIVCLIAWRLFNLAAKKCGPRITKKIKSFITAPEGPIPIAHDDQFPDRLLQPSEYSPLIAASKNHTQSDIEETVQTDQDTY